MVKVKEVKCATEPRLETGPKTLKEMSASDAVRGANVRNTGCGTIGRRRQLRLVLRLVMASAPDKWKET
jgi:hypothetical protein